MSGFYCFSNQFRSSILEPYIILAEIIHGRRKFRNLLLSTLIIHQGLPPRREGLRLGKDSKINDVDLFKREKFLEKQEKFLEKQRAMGPAILFGNPEIRKMLRLAGARKRDVFYDLGCGLGQNLIIASTEFPFRVQRCVGVETDPTRLKECRERIRELSLSERIEILDFEIADVISGRKGNISEASIVFFGLDISPKELAILRKKLQPKCRLIYYFYNGLIPEVKPTKVAFPFYLSISPFREEPRSNLDWLLSVVQKRRSSLHEGEPDEKELWDELAHDLNIRFGESGDDRRMIKRYRKRLDSFFAGDRSMKDIGVHRVLGH